MIYKYFLLFQSVWLCPLIHRSFKFRCHPICLVLLLLPVDWCYTQETIAKPNVMKVFLWILFLSLTFRSLIHFELIFCIWYKVRVLPNSSACEYLVCLAPFILPHWRVLSMIIGSYMQGFISELSILLHWSICLCDATIALCCWLCSFVVSFDTLNAPAFEI